MRAPERQAFAPTRFGREAHRGLTFIPRHRHDRSYAAVVLEGSYEESGSGGRYRVQAGEVLLHRRFDAHLDRVASAGAQVLNLPLTSAPQLAHGRLCDPDTIVRTAERDGHAAAALLLEQLQPVACGADDWPDLLARQLLAEPRLSLGDWAARHGLARATVSRGFRQVFGVPPAQFRGEARTQRALERIHAGAAPLCAIAAEAGFADQAHMTRAVHVLTGRPPGHWRRSN
jgi:AraC-like DNA-binding protein